MPLIQANGVKLHVQQLGTQGSLVAMVHGLMLGTKSTWFFGVAPALAESHRVLRAHERQAGVLIEERPHVDARHESGDGDSRRQMQIHW